jgi:diguanylate cyclase (GGDEF)-like protein
MVATSTLVWTAVHDVRGASSRVERIRAAVMRLDVVQHAISAETSAEAAFWRAPSAQSRSELVRALDGVPPALQGMSRSPDRADRAVAAQLAALNARYVSDIESRLNATGADSQPDAAAGPTLSSMEQLVDRAVARHQAEVADSRAAQEATLGRVAVLVPIALLTAVLAVLAAWSVILRQHRRLIVRSKGHEWASTHDELTGIANRTLMWEVLDAELDASTSDLALLLVDLDRFKDVNDTHGHAVGDAVLVAAARRLEETVGAEDVVARLGGDEFAVLVHPASRGRQVADDLRAAFHEAVQVGPELSLHCTATVGCAVVHEDSDRLDLLRRADLDMYAGKPRRSNHVSVNGASVAPEVAGALRRAR